MSQSILELLKDNYFFILYFAVLVLSLVRYRRYFDSVLKFFPILIGYTILTEILGFLIKNFEEFRITSSEIYPYANNAIYNIYDIIFTCYFLYIFHKKIKNRKFKNYIIYGSIIYAISVGINPFFEDWIIFPQTIAFTVGSILLIMSILLYFTDSKFRREKNNNLLVWIAIGLLIFNLFFPPILIAGIYYYDVVYQEFNLRQVHLVLITAMYACFIVGFLHLRNGF
jgi:hypothetical protein